MAQTNVQWFGWRPLFVNQLDSNFLIMSTYRPIGPQLMKQKKLNYDKKKRQKHQRKEKHSASIFVMSYVLPSVTEFESNSSATS
jgi:hypothetical protein